MSGPVIDFAAHFYAPYPEGRNDAEIESYAGAPICSDIEAARDQFEAGGLDGAVLSQPILMGSDDLERTREGNDALLEIVDAYDDFWGLAGIPTAAGGEAAAEEFERALDAGYNGGALEAKSDGIELIDDELDPIFEVANDTGAPVLVHPKLNDSLGPDSLSDHWHLNVIFGREICLAESISKVVHEGVYDRYPNLKLVFHHTGGNIAAFLGRIEGSLGRAHRDGDDHLKTYEAFRETLEEHVYIDTAGYYGDDKQFRRALEVFPASHVLYATDFPYETVLPETFEEIVDAIDSVSGGVDRDGILGQNALELLVNT